LITSRAAGGKPKLTLLHAQDGLALRQRLFDEPHALDGLHRAPDVVLIARGAREHERVEDDVFLRDAVGDAIVAGALGNGEFAFPRDRLRLLLSSSIEPMTIAAPNFFTNGSTL